MTIPVSKGLYPPISINPEYRNKQKNVFFTLMKVNVRLTEQKNNIHQLVRLCIDIEYHTNDYMEFLLPSHTFSDSRPLFIFVEKQKQQQKFISKQTNPL